MKIRSQFLSDVREVLGVPEWMMTIDNRKTKILHNGMCVQLLFHFKGNNSYFYFPKLLIYNSINYSYARKIIMYLFTGLTLSLSMMQCICVT